MSSITIDPQKCNRDDLCVAACPTRVIQSDATDGLPTPTMDFEPYCLSCGHCVAVCPTGALSLNWLSAEDCLPARLEDAVSPQQAEQFLRTRRSIRNFKNRTVERRKLEKLIEIACFAPSAKNNQPWHWTVIQEPAEVHRLAGMVVDWMRLIIEKYPEKAGQRGFQRAVSAWDVGQERICRGAPHIIVVHGDKNYGFGAEDTALALSYLELFAPLLGLGSCWGGYFYSAVNAHEPLFEALGLPAGHRAFGAVMVGYPKFKYQRFPLRKAPRVNWK